MTLVLTAATPGFVVQAADRLLTKSVAGRTRIFDAIANKTVIYRARDAIAAVSYSGVAYLGAKPMDEWIAEMLWGAPFHRGPDGKRPTMCSMGLRPNDWTIDIAITSLKQAVDSMPQGLIDKGGLFIVLAGWRQDRGPPRPFVVEIERPPRARTTAISGAPRRWPKRDFLLGRIGAGIPMDMIGAAFDRFRSSRALSILDTEQTFLELIRSAAEQQPSVGPNVLTVMLPQPGTGPVHCRFHGAAAHRAQLLSATGTWELDVAHGPSMMGANQVHAPHVIVGSSVIELDGVSVVLHGPPGRYGISGLASAIKRPSP